MARRVRLKGRFFVFLLILVAIIVGIVLLFTLQSDDGGVEIGSVAMQFDAGAVMIRDEICITTEQYDKIIYEVAEGEYVSNGARVAQVFRWGYQDETMQLLLDTQKEIQSKQLSLIDGVLNENMTSIDHSIQSNLEAIRAAVHNGSGNDLLTLEQSLKDLMEQRSENLKSFVQSDAALEELYQKETEQLATLESWKRDIVNNEGEGIVSFYFDGYERVLNADKLDLIDVALINDALKSSNTVTSKTTTADAPLYRLTNDKHWYIAFVTSASSARRVVKGESYVVTFGDYSDTPYTGIALDPVFSGQSVINILEFNEDMGTLLRVRTADVAIHKETEGFKVPGKALKMKDGVACLTLESGDTTVDIKVDVLASDEEYAVIRAAKGETLTLSVGQRFVVG